MKTTITLAPKEVEELIRKQLAAEGFIVEGTITLNVSAGYSDPREYQPSGLTSVTATVTRAEERRPSGPPANLMNGAY